MREQMKASGVAEGQLCTPDFGVVRARVGARRSAGPAGGPGGAGGRGLERAGARRSSRPRPVRPEAVAVAVRPPQLERPLRVVQPACAAPARPLRQRVLARAATAPSRAVVRVRRIVAGVAVGLVTAAVVVGLGLLAGATAQVRGGVDTAPAAFSVVDAPAAAAGESLRVTVRTPGTVWDLAVRVAPGAQGPALAAVAEHIVTANSLGSVELHPGQVLGVPRG